MKKILRHSRMLPLLIPSYAILFLMCCRSAEEKVETAIAHEVDSVATTAPVGPQTVLSRKEVPILCYHQLRDYKPTDSKTAKDYIVPPAAFREQLKILADSGYHAILPDQLMGYLMDGEKLPPNPFMLTFDDTDLEQYTVGATEMDQYGFKGVFFVMTVSLNKPRYMSVAQVRELSDKGHVIGSHTWDHHRVTRYTEEDWKIQVDEPSRKLEEITGKPVRYFAYPFGLWDTVAAAVIKKKGFKAAFQLSAKTDTAEPLYTVRRIIVPGTLSGPRLLARMKAAFH